MKVYRFILQTTVYIAAENLRQASMIAARDAGKIMGDDPNPSIEFDDEITHPGDLELANDGWDLNCIPYGEAGDQTIGQILER